MASRTSARARSGPRRASPKTDARTVADWLRLITALPNVSGQEHHTSEEVARAFAPFADRVERDRMNCVRAWRLGRGPSPRPRALVAAHMDRIGFIVRGIEKGGFLRVAEMGGFDPRTLPGREVAVHAKPPLVAVFGTKPPHLQKRGESEKMIGLADLYLDTGRSEREVRRRVPIGTMVTLRQPPVDLLGGLLAAPGMDDRSGVVALLRMMEILARERPAWDVCAVATVEEEIGIVSLGAHTVSESIRPDLGIAIDVTHGDMPDTGPGDTVPLGSGPALAVGANIHPGILDGLKRSARALRMRYRIEACPTSSGTDAMSIQIAAGGIPTAVIGIPCRYMHTSVETVDPNDVDRCGRLLAHYLARLPADWRASVVLKGTGARR
jgi:putative aminopeptidase FrvX